MKKAGFTLIELLVVIAIIGVLSSVVLASLNTSRNRANEARVRQDVRQLSVALQLYYDRFGVMPPNVTPDHNIRENLQPLVTSGIMPALPVSPFSNFPYRYYNYGPNTDFGGLVVAALPFSPPSLQYPGTCRVGSGGNWCSATLNNMYCICNTY